MREEVEALEHHADRGALACQILRPQVVEPALPVEAIAHEGSVDDDLARLDPLQHVDAAQQGRLARTRRPEDRAHLSVLDVQTHPREHMDVAEELVDVAHFDHVGGVRGGGGGFGVGGVGGRALRRRVV